MIELTEKGLYCPAGDFYIDPHRAVENAVITHAHSDHARRGSKKYLCASTSVRLLKCRLGQKIQVQGIPYGERFCMGKAQVSFHPAGHILGSAQVRVELDGEVWVASGDYKRETDPTCAPFEVVPCDVFITEATFGTPSFQWKKSKNLGKEIFDWWQSNSKLGKNSVIAAYSLGKAQRVLGELSPYAGRPVYTYPTVTELTDCYRQEGVKLAPSLCTSSLDEKDRPKGELFIIPPSSQSPVLEKILGNHETAFASGWTAYGNRGYDHGFLMSDHADWNDLLKTIQETGAREIYVLHRENGKLVSHLKKSLGLEAHPAKNLRARSSQLSLF